MARRVIGRGKTRIERVENWRVMVQDIAERLSRAGRRTKTVGRNPESEGKDVGVVKCGEIKYGEKWNEEKWNREMREKISMCKFVWEGFKMSKILWGGGGRKVYGRFSMNQPSRTKFCVKTVTGRAWRAWSEVVWGMEGKIWWNCTEYLMLEVEESKMGGCKS